MSEFVSNPLFGLALSILAYLVGMLIDDSDLGCSSGDWNFNQCYWPNPFEVVENR